MDDRILATAWLCLAQGRREPDPLGFALSFPKALASNGWPEEQLGGSISALLRGSATDQLSGVGVLSTASGSH